MLILDVGCGDKPKGHVNCDLKKSKKARNFVLCDAGYLPFETGVFQVVYASAVLEHLKDPFQSLKEFKRVSRCFVYIKTPNTPNVLSRQRKDHLHGWDETTLRNLLETVFPRVTVTPSNRVYSWGQKNRRMRLIYAFLKVAVKAVLPNELTAICRTGHH